MSSKKESALYIEPFLNEGKLSIGFDTINGWPTYELIIFDLEENKFFARNFSDEDLDRVIDCFVQIKKLSRGMDELFSSGNEKWN